MNRLVEPRSSQIPGVCAVSWCVHTATSESNELQQALAWPEINQRTDLKRLSVKNLQGKRARGKTENKNEYEDK